LMVHPTRVTNSIDRLAKAGFVERRPNPRDGRGTLAAITETGRAVVELATKDLMDADFGLGALSEPDRRATVLALRDLRVDAGDFDDS
jgi:DNA-binding MarR family transcriptional regulator